MQELQTEWDSNSVERKLEAAILSTSIVFSSPAMNPRYARGVSRILKVFTPAGQHIGTIHEIVMPDGRVAHRHPKDYTRRDCSRMRCKSEPVNYVASDAAD